MQSTSSPFLQVVEILKSHQSLRDAFMSTLHKAPYHLRYQPYKDLVMTSTTPRSNLLDPIVQESHGLVLKKETYEVVSMGPSAPIRITEEDLEQLASQFPNATYQTAEDGTVLRVFHYNDEWMMCTSHKMNAKALHWSSTKSFWQLFEDAAGGDLDELFDTHLDKAKSYSFILLHPEHWHVVKHETPQVVYIQCRDNNTLLEEPLTQLPFAKLPKTLNAPDMTLLDETHRGIMTSLKVSDVVTLRYLCDKSSFVRGEALRANMPSFELSYLSAKEAQEREAFKEVFPHTQAMTKEMDLALYRLFKAVHSLYIRQFVNKEKVLQHDKDDILCRALYSIHHKYLSQHNHDPQQKKLGMTVKDVEHVLRGMGPTALSQLLDDTARAICLATSAQV